jgi:hypothetical protein
VAKMSGAAAITAPGPLRSLVHLAKRSTLVSLISFVIMTVVGVLVCARCAGAIIILRRRGSRFLAPPDERLIAELAAMLLFAGVVSIAVPGLVSPASVNSDSARPGWAVIADLSATGLLWVAGIAILGLSVWVQIRNRRSAPVGRHARRREPDS